MNQRQAARILDVPRSTLGKILKRRELLNPGSSQKRNRSGQSPAVDTAVLDWLQDALKGDSPINGPILRGKAKEFAEILGENKFTGSDGWFERFKKRNKLNLKVPHGGAAETNQHGDDDRLETKMQCPAIDMCIGEILV